MPQPLTWDSPGLAFDAPGVFWDGEAPNPPNKPMSDINRVSATLSDQDIADINTAIDTIKSKLPFLVSLSNEERKVLPKLGDKSQGFDDKCTAYMASNPEFIPGFIDNAEVDKDRALLARIMQFFPSLQTLCETVDDTPMVASSEVWMADLAYYQNVREAAKRGLPGADTIYGELRARFPAVPKSAQPKPAKPTP
jgi:hypothetical protein